MTHKASYKPLFNTRALIPLTTKHEVILLQHNSLSLLALRIEEESIGELQLATMAAENNHFGP